MLSLNFHIRPGIENDIPTLRQIELLAARGLKDVLPDSALHENTEVNCFILAIEYGLLWVAEHDSQAIGFAHVEMLDDSHPHLEEMDVHPNYQRQGVGRALVWSVLDWFGNLDFQTLTLITFRDVPFNMPFYANMGFREAVPEDMSAEIADLLASEAQRGFDISKRVVMKIQGIET